LFYNYCYRTILIEQQDVLPPRNPRRSRTLTRVEVGDRLRELALQRGPEAKLPTVRQLCDTLGTSVATLDNALDELEQQHIIYRVQGSGIYVSPRVNYRHIAVALEVGFFQNEVASPFWGMLWGLFVTRAQERADTKHEEFSFHLVSSWDVDNPGLPPQLVEMLRSGQVAGAVGIGVLESAAATLRAHCPYVAYAGPADYQVHGDGAAGMRMGVAALAEQGCRRIGLWVPAEANRTYPEVPGDSLMFHEALRAVGLPFIPDVCRDNAVILNRAGAVTRQSHQEQGYDAVMELFRDSGRAKPDGLLIGDDMMTSGALAAFQELGIRVGRDVHVATQANFGSPILFGYENVITRLVYDPAECVDKVLGTLERAMRGDENIPELTWMQPRVVPPGQMPTPVRYPFMAE
jgi:DNA-binding LacI/PurR family transcriptional regulator